MAEISPNLGNETYMQIQEVLKVPSKTNPKRSTPRYIIIKRSKVKENEY